MADARDERADARERAVERIGTEGAADRAGALRDRRAATSDRAAARDDRKAASTDRDLAARDRRAASIDQLTGAHRRDAGIVELEREVVRARRTAQSFTIAFIDIDDLKETNDSLGHATGDQLLRATTDVIRAHLRPYDLIIRYGGDEFVCALPDVTAAQAADRFARVKADLAAAHEASVSVGLAELEADESVDDLLLRADQAMYRARQQP
ncbi:MAG: GGDEF domain-containing protein [Solirubrobacteraceae bacterium]|jgi:diguanylate cyclase (GGDEF)-like protein